MDIKLCNKCQRCNSDRLLEMSAKCCDAFYGSYKDKEIESGYAPSIQNVCGGDYVDAIICLECGQVQGVFPVEDSNINLIDDEDDSPIGIDLADDSENLNGEFPKEFSDEYNIIYKEMQNIFINNLINKDKNIKY